MLLQEAKEHVFSCSKLFTEFPIVWYNMLFDRSVCNVTVLATNYHERFILS